MKRHILALLFALSAVAAPAYAQTDEPTTPPAEATAVVTPAPEQPPVVVIPPASDTVQLSWTALAGLITLVLTVGVAGGAGGAIAIVRLIRNNEAIMFAMEKLFQSASPETQRLIRGGVEVGKEVTGLADELTDGILPGTASKVVA